MPVGGVESGTRTDGGSSSRLGMEQLWRAYRLRSSSAVARYRCRSWLYLLGRNVMRPRDAALAASRYAKLVEQGKDVTLWDRALRQQI